MFSFMFPIFLIFQSSILHSEAKNILLSKIILHGIKQKADQVLEIAGGNTQCAKDLKTLFNDAMYMKTYAMEMLDASAKLSSGILAGNFYMTGNFDQCLDINVRKNESKIHGQYCTVVLMPSENNPQYADLFSVGMMKDYLGIKTSMQTTEVLQLIKMTYGICIPHTCSIENLQTLWNYIEKTFSTPFHINFVDVMCSSHMKSISPFPVDQYIIAGFGIYIVILLISTLYDLLIYQQRKDNPKCLWISFSLYTNLKKIITVKDMSDDIYLYAVNGIKVLCMFWVVYGHRVMMNLFSGIINLIEMQTWKQEVLAIFTLSATYSVDTFLTLSGLVLSYSILVMYYRMGRKQILFSEIYMYRFLRLSPALFALILFYISIFKNLTSGPIWPLMSTKAALACYKGWFTTLFFINNFLDVTHQCVEQAWYLAVDSQIFLFSPILLINLIKRPFKTCLICIGLCIFSGIYTFVITIKYNYGAIYFESNKEYLQNIYQPTLVRMPPWFIGFIFGYIIFKYKEIKIPKAARILLWMSVCFAISVLCLIIRVFISATEYNAFNAALYNSTAKQFWAITIGIIVWLCISDRHGTINRFLSLPIFQIIVKLSYSVFLVHAGVTLYFVGGKKHSTYFKNIQNLHDVIGDLFFIFIVATMWCLAFESPFVALARYYFAREYNEIKPQNKNITKKKRRKNKNNYYVYVYKYKDGVNVVNKID